MNSRELLDQATAKVEQINELMAKIDVAECVLSVIGDGCVCFYTEGIGTTFVAGILPPEKMRRVNEEVTVEIIRERDARTFELEKLLGIRKPATIDLAFEKAIQEMKKTSGISKESLDELSDKAKISSKTIGLTLTDILQKESKKFEDKPIIPEESPDKYPAKKDKRVKVPENMLEADVRRMYIDEGKDRKYIANHYDISESRVNNYLFLHEIKRKPTKASKTKAKQPAEMECP